MPEGTEATPEERKIELIKRKVDMDALAYIEALEVQNEKYHNQLLVIQDRLQRFEKLAKIEKVPIGVSKRDMLVVNDGANVIIDDEEGTTYASPLFANLASCYRNHSKELKRIGEKLSLFEENISSTSTTSVNGEDKPVYRVQKDAIFVVNTRKGEMLVTFGEIQDIYRKAERIYFKKWVIDSDNPETMVEDKYNIDLESVPLYIERLSKKKCEALIELPELKTKIEYLEAPVPVKMHAIDKDNEIASITRNMKPSDMPEAITSISNQWAEHFVKYELLKKENISQANDLNYIKGELDGAEKALTQIRLSWEEEHEARVELEDDLENQKTLACNFQKERDSLLDQLAGAREEIDEAIESTRALNTRDFLIIKHGHSIEALDDLQARGLI